MQGVWEAGRLSGVNRRAGGQRLSTGQGRWLENLQAGMAEVPLVRSWPNREHELLHDLLQPEPVCRVIE